MSSSYIASNEILSSVLGGMDPAVLKELPPELLAEIESTMPLCERVKMNKRKRSTINEKPKYAEVSSDDDANGECKLTIWIIVL